MADVDISYNNSVIASLSDSGTEVLETNGTFMADDITITYEKSGGGGGLPSVTSADNGKVLTVENGAWAKSDRIVQLFAILDHTTYAITADNEDGKNYSYYEIADMVYTGGYSFVLNIRVQGFPGTKMAFVHPETPSDNEIGFIGQMTNYDSVPVLSYDIRFTASDSEGEIVFTGGIREKGNFIVTLTPTSPDYSGTMDKTIAEINTAYEAGQQIWFKIALPGMGYLMNMAYLGNGDPESTYPSFNVNLIETNSNLMFVVWTGYTNDGTNQTYSTKAYSLTPLS